MAKKDWIVVIPCACSFGDDCRALTGERMLIRSSAFRAVMRGNTGKDCYLIPNADEGFLSIEIAGTFHIHTPFHKIEESLL